MVACTRCGFEQIGTQAYCEHCGMFLPALAIYNPTPSEGTPVIPKVVSEPQQIAIVGRLTPTMIVERSVREFLACIGLLIAAFGLYGSIYGLTGSGFALFLGLTLFFGGTVFITILLFVQKSLPHLQRWQRTVGWVVATAVGCVVFLMLPEVPETTRLIMDLGFGMMFFLYGLTLAVLAIW